MYIGKVSNAASFAAKIIRQQDLNYDFQTGKQSINYSSKKDVTDSYDKQIFALQRQKAAALELDEFMHSDEVRELVSKLPENDEIEICNKFYNNAEQGEDLKLEHHHILFDHNSDCPDKKWSGLSREEQYKLSYVDVQNKDGSIDKQKIIDMLKNLTQFFNN